MTYAEVSISLHVRVYVFQLKHIYWSCTSLLTLVQCCWTEKSRGRFVLAVPGTGICWTSSTNSVTPLGWFHCHHMYSFFFHCRASPSAVDKDIICATVLWDQGQCGQSLFFQLTNILRLTLLPSMVVSAWPTLVFCNSQGICFTDVMWEWSH